MTQIGIINYSMGNIGSIKSALGFYDYDVAVITKPEEIDSTNILILAGVGNFAAASDRLKKLRFWDKLDEEVMCNEKPVLGICLGMQLFADKGFENGEHTGFGWIKGRVIKMEGESIRIPHIGWNEITNNQAPLFKGILNDFFYFMHSYHFVPEEKNVEIAWTRYGGIKFVSAVRKKNIVGVQFHPEKSQGDGLRILRNFVEMMS
jgi:imidazole glycerol-phosphate synthase subunit HisH